MTFRRIGRYKEKVRALIGVFLFLSFWSGICSGQDFIALFREAAFTRSVELGIPGAVCIVSQKGNPIAVMWKWWGKDVRLYLSSHQLKSILGQGISPVDVKVLNRCGKFVTTGTADGVTITLGSEPRYFVIGKTYHPPFTFADDLSKVKVSLLQGPSGRPKVMFENLSGKAVITIFDDSGKLIKEISNLRARSQRWNCTNSEGLKVPPGIYRYRILDRGGAVVGTIIIPE